MANALRLLMMNRRLKADKRLTTNLVLVINLVRRTKDKMSTLHMPSLMDIRSC
jgi:hypothetical protein